jgi:hypothetical protein
VFKWCSEIVHSLVIIKDCVYVCLYVCMCVCMYLHKAVLSLYVSQFRIRVGNNKTVCCCRYCGVHICRSIALNNGSTYSSNFIAALSSLELQHKYNRIANTFGFTAAKYSGEFSFIWNLTGFMLIEI